MPSNWGTFLHKDLEVLANEELKNTKKLKLLQREIVKFESCSSCIEGEYPECSLGSRCFDRIKLMRKLTPHYAGIRTLLNRFYAVRAANNLLIQADNAIFSYNIDKLKVFLQSLTPNQRLITDDGDKLETIGDNLDKEVFEMFGDVWNKFDIECKDYPKETCIICNMWTEKKKLRCFKKW